MTSWEPVEDVDTKKRLPSEWAEIYCIRLLTYVPNNKLWSEYEWAWNFDQFQYNPVPDKIWKVGEMELRAAMLKRDLFLSADLEEKVMLQDRYIETAWAKKQLQSGGSNEQL